VDTTTSIRNFIGGEQVEPADGRTYDLVNPTTGEVFAQAPLSSEADVDKAFVLGGGCVAVEVLADEAVLVASRALEELCSGVLVEPLIAEPPGCAHAI
jgi:betaine-aldehyde dehydrogenase